jgi:hypothetical protein
MNRSVSLTVTVEDYVAANRLHFLNSLRTGRSIATLVGSILSYVVWSAIAYLDQWPAIYLTILNAGVAAVLLFLIAQYFLLIPSATRRTYQSHKALQRPSTCSWSESGLTVTNDNGEWRLAWSDFLKWTEDAQVFLLYQSPGLFNMLPKRALTPEQIADVRQCASNIADE